MWIHTALFIIPWNDFMVAKICVRILPVYSPFLTPSVHVLTHDSTEVIAPSASPASPTRKHKAGVTL